MSSSELELANRFSNIKIQLADMRHRISNIEVQNQREAETLKRAFDRIEALEKEGKAMPILRQAAQFVYVAIGALVLYAWEHISNAIK